MKKLLFAFLTIFLAFSSEAKVYFGGSFNINFDTVKDTYNNGEVIINDKTYQLGFNPKVYWNISEKMQLGGRVGFQYGQMYTGSVFSWDGDINKEEPIVNRAIGWSAAPFFRLQAFPVENNNHLGGSQYFCRTELQYRKGNALDGMDEADTVRFPGSSCS